MLGTFVLVYFANLLLLHAHFDRYVLPLVPALGALAGRLRALAPVTLLMLVVPLTWSVRDARDLTKTDTRVVARALGRRPPAARRLPRRRPVDARLPRLPGPRAQAAAGPGSRTTRTGTWRGSATEGVRYVVVTGAVEDRVLAAASHYPRETRFYETLRRRAARLLDPPAR